MDVQFGKLTDFINKLENRRDNETVACTTNKIIIFLKDIVTVVQEMYLEIKTTTNKLQDQINSGVINPIETKNEEIQEEIEPSSGLPTEVMDSLREWNKGKSALVLFKGQVPSPKSFNEIVGGHKNISIVIRTTDDSIFGCFASKLRSPISQRDNDFDVVNDKQFYVFTLMNHCGVLPSKFNKKSCEYTLARFSSMNETMVVEAENCFKIATQDGISSVSKYFVDEYTNVPPCSTDLFVSKSGCDTFAINSLHIIEWK